MYLGLDLWDKRCGISLYIEWIVVPKWIYPRQTLISELKKIVKDYSISTIVVWLPYDLYGKDTKQLDKTKLFIEKLVKFFPEQKIDSIDERFTSFEADFVLDTMWIKQKKWKRDDISAVLILESYLERVRGKNI